MVIVMIRRCVKRDKEGDFLASYKGQKPDHPDFIDETLTKINNSSELPEPLRSWSIDCGDCVTYVNIARWKSVKSFEAHFKPKTMHDPKIECSDRIRVVLDEVKV